MKYNGEGRREGRQGSIHGTVIYSLSFLHRNWETWTERVG